MLWECLSSFYFHNCIYLFIFWLCWVSVAARAFLSWWAGASPVMEHRLRGAWASVVVAPGRQSTGLAVVAHGLSCSTSWGIFLDQGWNLCLPNWQAEALTRSHQRNPIFFPSWCNVSCSLRSGHTGAPGERRHCLSLAEMKCCPFSFGGSCVLDGPGSRPGEAVQCRSTCRAFRVLGASFSAILLNTDMHTNNTGTWATCRCSGAVRVRCGLTFCIPNKLLGDADATGSWKGNYWEKQDLRGFLQGSKKVESWASLALASNDQIPSRSLTFCKTPWRRAWQTTPVFLLGSSHGQGSLQGYSPWGRKRVGYNRATKTTTKTILEVL